jgi:ABC-2 type transport system ATP-binding protein
VDAIVAEGLEKRYRDVLALNGVTFSVRENEVFGLLGPNGAGKSTTVRVLTTLTRPDDGRAEVAGHDVVRHPNRVRRSIGYVPQESGVDRDATGRENLLLQGGSRACLATSCARAWTSCSTSSGSPRPPTESSAGTPAA